MHSDLTPYLCIGFASAVIPSSLVVYGILKAIVDSRERQAREAQAGNARELAARAKRKECV